MDATLKERDRSMGELQAATQAKATADKLAAERLAKTVEQDDRIRQLDSATGRRQHAPRVAATGGAEGRGPTCPDEGAPAQGAVVVRAPPGPLRRRAARPDRPHPHHRPREPWRPRLTRSGTRQVLSAATSAVAAGADAVRWASMRLVNRCRALWRHGDWHVTGSVSTAETSSRTRNARVWR